MTARVMRLVPLHEKMAAFIRVIMAIIIMHLRSCGQG